MATSEIAATETRGLAAVARADALAASARLRPADPVRPRFDPVDAPAPRRPSPARADRPQDQPVPSGRDAVEDTQERPRRPRAIPAYVTQVLAQDGDGDRPPPSAFRLGAQAYRQAMASAPPTPGIDVMSPFPLLASGKTLDLSV